MIKIIVFIVSISMVIFSTSIYPQEQITSLTSKEKNDAIDKICTLLNKFYIYPEVAAQMEKHIKAQQTTGVFENVKDPKEFAKSMTQELRSICHDKHLDLFFGINPDLQPKEDKILKRILNQLEREKQNYGLNKVEILPGNVGYMSIRSVMYYEPIKEIVSTAMKFLASTDAIIFDLRENKGGDAQYMAYLFSYFFSRSTQLSSIYFRDRDRTFDFWTKENIQGQKMADVPLYVLIGKKTFSAAESFAYDLQSLKRATIIGEVSAGGANPASSFVVYKDLRISIPLGRAINPITGTNWEGVGVKPDIEVPADSAFEVAVEHAKEAAQKYYETKRNKIIAGYNNCLADIAKAEKLYEENNEKEADSLIGFSLNNAITDNLLTEDQINRIGYDYIEKNNYPMAIAILKFNVLSFPNSANAYDSIAEAFLKAGNKEQSIENYEKSLELNPENANAVEKLKELRRNK